MAEGHSTRFWIFVASGIVVVVLIVFVVVTHDRATNVLSVPAMTAEEKAYLSQIALTNPHMSVATNGMGDTLYYLDADLSNRGSRSIRRLELQLEFLDPFQQVVLRDTENPITSRAPPLGAGKTRHLRVTFEHLPAEWNDAPPRFTALLVKFQRK